MEAENLAAPFGEWLLRKLREQKVSLSDVARLAQCDYTYLWRLVNVGRARGRQYRRPSYAMAERIGRALGAPHEALTAAGYLPAENLQNSRVVDALARVEEQLRWLRDELAPETGPARVEVIEETGAACPSLPLVAGPAWPEDPDAAAERIDLPEWLTAGACWAVRVPAGTRAPELRPGDLALIRQGSARAGQLAAVLRRGRLDFAAGAAGETILGTITAIVRQFENDEP